MKKDIYLNYKDKLEKKLKIINEKSNKLSIIRLVIFAVFIITTIFCIVKFYLILLILSIFLFIGFLVVAIYHSRIANDKKLLQIKELVIEDYLCRFDNRWVNFADSGIEFNVKEDAFLSDLDIVGDTSLFKYINISKTRGGRKKLLNRLSNPKFSNAELVVKQESLKEVALKTEFSVNLQASLRRFATKSRTKSLQSIVSSIEDRCIINIFLLVLSILSTMAFIVLIILSLTSAVSILFVQPILILQIALSGITIKFHGKSFAAITAIRNLAYTKEIYQTIAEEEFHHPNLKEYQSNIKHAIEGINFASKIEVLDSFRHNFISYLILNAIMPWNTMILLFYKKFITKHFSNVSNSIESIEEFEVLCSLAIIPQVKEDICLPVMREEVSIRFNNLKHPLLVEEEFIPNDFAALASVSIITGSNMSGKTSFLRTIGINLCLMNAGGYVNALSFSSSYLKIFTSMRITDDINKGVSSFYAEILRIKKAILYQKTNEPMIAFIDEVFRGTNSNDRICGAISMIKNLCRDNVILFITTHDFELCEVKDSHISNYHFTEYYEGENIKFDYLLKNGKCQTTNAQFLLKLAGIMED